jgi:hypothetical protein
LSSDTHSDSGAPGGRARTRKSHCGDPSLVFTRCPVTADPPTRSRRSSTGFPFTHAAAANAARDGIALDEEAEVDDEVEVEDEPVEVDLPPPLDPHPAPRTASARISP